jgi:uncharacterized membrane protein YfcA
VGFDAVKSLITREPPGASYFRAGLVNLDRIAAHAPIILNIPAGSLIGSYLGVRFATRINEHTLIRVVVVFLVILSAVLIGHDFVFQAQ